MVSVQTRTVLNHSFFFVPFPRARAKPPSATGDRSFNRRCRKSRNDSTIVFELRLISIFGLANLLFSSDSTGLRAESSRETIRILGHGEGDGGGSH